MGQLTLSNEQLSDLSHWLKVISEPNRLLLLEQIIEGVQCNCELGSALQITPNLISHHLSVLREAGLVEVERDPVDARWIYYSINPEALAKLRSLFGAFLDPERVQARHIGCGPRPFAQRLTDGQKY